MSRSTQITKPELNSTFKILIDTTMSAPYDLERVEAIFIQEGKLLNSKDA
jgi:hypothetical protein